MLAASRDRYAYGSHIPQADPLKPSVLSEVKSCLATLELSTVTAETERKRGCVGICDLYGYEAAKTEQGGNGSVRITDC